MWFQCSELELDSYSNTRHQKAMNRTCKLWRIQYPGNFDERHFLADEKFSHGLWTTAIYSQIKILREISKSMKLTETIKTTFRRTYLTIEFRHQNKLIPSKRRFPIRYAFESSLKWLPRWLLHFCSISFHNTLTFP